MSLPLILSGRILKLEIYLIEPNQVIGRANKYFLNFCKNIFCYEKNVKNIPNKFKYKIVEICPLVKKSIYELIGPRAQKLLKIVPLPPPDFTCIGPI